MQPSAPPARRLPALEPTVVLRHGEPEFSDQFGARDVWVFESAGVYHLHYDAAGEDGWLAALATSADGVEWTKHGPVLELGEPGEPDSASASYGTTYFDGEQFHLFYLGTPNVTDDYLKTPSFPYRTLKAVADGPRGPWRKQPAVVPFEVVAGSWYSETASPGAIVAQDNEYVMLFSAACTDADGQIWRTLGVARSTDLNTSWTVDPEPLLPITEQIENSSLYFDEPSGRWLLFTNHIAVDPDAAPVPPQNSQEYTDAIWMYWSTDPTKFDPADKAVVVDAESSGWSPKVIGLPSVLRIGDRLAIYFDGSTTDDIGHGHRDVGLAWLDLPIVLP
ncbi:hypothetical protein HPO96_05570 [Kribbella sandramycini]|uniref:Glycosyl hydrolase family 32 n=1 Tax=Kribbella sandramycini TaxID=60450 RepID=A0A7Y4NYC8_9ACTN|nr:hypothetical protein [Kribbella sandramycini]MBB6567691.1 hypothetical protein [Kribbella sandramycini]NOL39708.1 hypothetical protein [Kribbella sandramycini]